MGIWEWIGSTAEAVKRNAPDATPVKNGHTYGVAAFSKIDQAVRVNSLSAGCQTMKQNPKSAKHSARYALFKLNPDFTLRPKRWRGCSFQDCNQTHERCRLKKKAESAEEELSVGSVPAAVCR